MPKNLIKQQSGMSLIQVAIAMGVSSVMIYASTQSIIYMIKGTNMSTSKQSSNDQWSLINNYLQNPTLCQIFFNNAVNIRNAKIITNNNAFDPSKTTPIHVALSDPTSPTLEVGTPTVMRTPPGGRAYNAVEVPNPDYLPPSFNILFQEGKTTNGLMPTSITIKKTTNLSTNNPPSFTDSSGNNTFWPVQADLQIQFSNAKSTQTTVGSSQYQKTFSLNMTFQRATENTSGPWQVATCSLANDSTSDNSAGFNIPSNNINARNRGRCSAEGTTLRDTSGLYVCTNGIWMILANKLTSMCSNNGGILLPSSTGPYCLMPGGCPAGWTLWTATTNNYCEADGIGNTGCAVSGCNTGNHTWRAGSAETCNYRYYHGCNTPGTQYDNQTCTANITQQGCVPN